MLPLDLSPRALQGLHFLSQIQDVIPIELHPIMYEYMRPKDTLELPTRRRSEEVILFLSYVTFSMLSGEGQVFGATATRNEAFQQH